MAIIKIKDASGKVYEILAIKGEKGDKGDGYILTDEDKGEIAARVSGDFVSYSEDVSENLTDEQKKTARDNIGAISQTELNEAIGDINSILATVVSGVSE